MPEYISLEKKKRKTIMTAKQIISFLKALKIVDGCMKEKVMQKSQN